MPSTSTLVDSIYTRRVSAGECYPPDLVKSHVERAASAGVDFRCFLKHRFLLQLRWECTVNPIDLLSAS